MDKYEYKVRADEIKELIAQGDYAQAAEIADTIDWRRVKSVMMLCTISDLYKINRRYEDARDMLLLAYERRPGGRTICYSLCELSIKMEEYVQAVEYYKEFVQVAPKDSGRYILQYKLYEAQDVSLEERIEVLEELKKRDYREKWAYELAYLYHRIGLGTRCVEECDEMILWFGEGKYVIKAMELKKLHEPLTPAQQDKYDSRFCGYEEAVEMSAEQNALHEEVVEPVSQDTTVYEPIYAKESEATAADEMDIHVKTMDVGEYNTINLQAELAEGLREVLGEGNGMDSIQNPITRSIIAPMLESDTETLDYPQIEEVEEEDLESVSEEMEGSEVFFGETGEIGALNRDMQELTEEAIEETIEENVEVTVEEAVEEIVEEAVKETTAEVTEELVDETPATKDTTAEVVMEQMRQNTILNAEPPKELAGVLSQESDGQLSLVMPEKENVEKQITGQMNIEDILAEWERMKKENEEKRKEEVRQHVLQQTGTMFTEFDIAVRDGLLEQIEKGNVEGISQESEVETATPNEEIEEDFIEKLVRDFVERPKQEALENANTAEETVEEHLEEISEEVPEETKEVLEESEEETEDIVWDVEEVSEETEENQEEQTEVEGETLEENSVEEDFTWEDSVEEVIQETAVERDKEKVRGLTKEERELYAPFIQSRSAREQLVRAIDNISLAAYTGNVIITGEEGMDTLTLAKNMIREVQMADSNFSGKVAKISGSALNKKDVSVIVNDLKNGALIILNASQMNSETAENLNKALQQEMQGIIVVLVDTKKSMNYFLEDHEELHGCFTARMDVEALSDDTLVAFGKQYARELEYSIDEMGMLALHTRIAELQTSDHVVTVVEVKEIVDEAIYHANKKTIGHFFDILFAKRYDNEDMIILGEKDFI